MSFNVDELSKWDDRIRELVERYGLNCYPQEFEICDHNEMLGYMAYTGMPSHYPHWSYGKSFERQKTMYEYGVSGLPYEMVINSNPCLAYLMKDNTLLLQVLTIAHVYGHNDFFANNFTFTSGTAARHVLPRFKSHANRISSYMEDPSIGVELVESALDDAHAICYQRSRNLAIQRLSQDEQVGRAWERAQPAVDPWREIHPKQEYEAPNLSKIPAEPDENILQFIATYNPYLPEWKRDVIGIVDHQTQYFLPQMDTKIMNEGWASYWHHKILNELQRRECILSSLCVTIRYYDPIRAGLTHITSGSFFGTTLSGGGIWATQGTSGLRISRRRLRGSRTRMILPVARRSSRFERRIVTNRS